MKKRVVFGLVAASVAAVMCVGLVGCGEVDAKSVNGYEVSEIEWTTAIEKLSTEDLTIDYSASATCTADLDFSYAGGNLVSGDYKVTSSGKAIKNAKREYVSTVAEAKFSGEMKFISQYANLNYEEQEKEENEEYCVEATSGYTHYYKDENDEWATETLYSDLLQSGLSNYVGLLDYDDFEYSEEMNGYVPKAIDEVDEDGNTNIYIIKFDHLGRLAAVYIEIVSTDYTVENEGYPSALTLTSETVVNIVVSYETDDAITLPTVKKS